MDNYEPQAPIPWTMMIVTFLLSTILLVSLCLAILDPAQMELIQSPDTGSPVGSGVICSQAMQQAPLGDFQLAAQQFL